MIGPSNVPRPPTRTMKIIFAVQLTPKIESGPSGRIEQLPGEDDRARGRRSRRRRRRRGSPLPSEHAHADARRPPPRRRGSPGATRRDGCGAGRRAGREQHRDGRERRPVRVVQPLLRRVPDVERRAAPTCRCRRRSPGSGRARRGSRTPRRRPTSRSRTRPPRSHSTTAATGIATAPPMSVASSIDRYGLSECWTERKTAAYAPMPMNRLLADRHEPAVAGERVPHHRHDDEEVELDEVVLRVLAEHERREREQDDEACEPAGEGDRQRRPALDAYFRHGGGGGAHPAPRSVSRRPPACIAVRATSTARKTTCPESAKYSGLICAPTVCATPSTIPPPSVPQSGADPADDDGLEGVDELGRRPRCGSNDERIP